MKMNKKIIALLLAVLMLGLTACGDTNTEKPETPKDPEPKAETVLSSEVYDAFLSGKQAVTVGEGFEGFAPGEFLVREFCDTYADYAENNIQPVDAYNLYYAMIDCGNDGNPELAVRLDLMTSDYADLTEQFIMKYMDERLVLIGQYQSYYRYYTDINDYGVIVAGGSSSAFSYGNDVSFINADGEEIFIYSEEDEMGQAEPYIPYYKMPGSLRPEDYPFDCFSQEEDYYVCAIYNFTPFDCDIEYYDNPDAYNAYSDEYNKNNIYVFMDDEGKVVEPEGFKELYDSLGLKYCTEDEMERLMGERLESVGITEEERYAGSIEYRDFDDKYTL